MDRSNDAVLYHSHIEQLCQRSRALLQAMQEQFLVIHAGHALHQIFAEQSLPFVPSALFRQWLAIGESEHAWIITSGDAPAQLFLLQEHFNPAWQQSSWWPLFQVTLLRSAHEIERYLPHPLRHSIYLGPHPDIAKALGFELINPELAIHYFQYHRATKTDYELFCLRQAGTLAQRGLQQVHDRFYQGASGLDIYLGYLKAIGCAYLNDPVQVAFNEQIGQLSPMRMSAQLLPEKDSYSLWFNATAEFRGYRVKIGRCFGFRRDYYQQLVASLEQLLLGLTEELHQGRPLSDISRRYRHHLAKWLVHWELVQGSIQQCLHSGLLDILCPQPVCEFVGLSINEPGAQLSDPTGSDIMAQMGEKDIRTLDARQVIAFNIGIFVNPNRLEFLKKSSWVDLINWSQIDMLQHYGGITMTDTGIVTSDGIERITA
ncbi:Xaa-Pro dipeptidase [Celerinatantimonas diazotrophica]|uniref:Xaa-Pro dipeptidase n=2 Tax=Celerinatantimonas diazotrophica TaxID=412034 RepID=A0A4R1J9W3_9GAMM|nr:Xaa-Pro dipeptidase [Celerinatantimonas diazotrophica]CAG9295074.1 Xaa-Pro dipeptidase [Celerinatantimonas diazotrophica]